MASLYEISGNMHFLLVLVEDEETDFDAVSDTLESVECDFGEKMEGCVYVIRNLEAEADACEKEEKRFRERKDRARKKAESLKAYMLDCMKRAEMTKVDAGIFKVSRRNAGGKMPVIVMDEPKNLPKKFQTITVTVVANKDAIREWLEAGNTSDQFCLGERSQYITIK